jgi:hypothetical protein
MHLLSGAPVVQSSSEAGLSAESPSLGISELAAVKANVARLEAELRELTRLSQLKQKSQQYQRRVPKSLHYRAGAAA